MMNPDKSITTFPAKDLFFKSVKVCPGSLVIRFPAVNPACTVNLFHEQKAGYLVGERHL